MMEQQEYFGFKSIDNLKDILRKENSKNIFLVTGKKSFESCGAKKVLESLLENYNIHIFNDFKSNPDIKDIDKGYAFFSREKIDTIIGVGGGSSIDVAKSIKLFSFKKNKEKIPLIAIPTTAGTGSEATYFIVYYVGKEKQSKGIPNLTLPNYSICDPQFTLSLPKNITATTGMDALTQAIESYWSVNSTEKSKKFARESINLLVNNLENAVNNSSKKSKENVMKAANLAGKAINISKTTACHSISYPITSYFGISHGHAVGLTLGEMLVYNSKISKKDCLDERGINYVKKTISELVNLIGLRSPSEGKNKIQKLMKNIGLKTKLSELNINEDGIKIIIKKGFNSERMKNNPRLLTKKDFKKIIIKIY